MSDIEDKLTSTESIERIADYFSQISQEYPPLNINLLPADVKVKILTPVNPDELTQLSDYEVYEKIRKSKKPRSNVPGDLKLALAKTAQWLKNILELYHLQIFWAKLWNSL